MGRYAVTGPDVRTRLLDAAQDALAATGIRGTTVQHVAQRAGVSRAWLYRHFPDKSSLLGAAIVRLTEDFLAAAHRALEGVDDFDLRLAAGVAHGRTMYDSPGSLILRLREAEPDEFAACVGAGVQGMVPTLAQFWEPYVAAARRRGEIHPATDIAEAAEWVARVLISLGSAPGETLDPDDQAAVLRHLRHYVLPGLRHGPVVD
ncbi:TetR/AcrR family transcriptional regulator [Gordonia sp. HY442]|uniref:TetR/AcrR family transcriptional regulator n=1 Tax=Gordonia zhenghanii TaxID=2911516 RepID=UPI001F21840D|nr:TetR/AcrR family transcriptional regulator [Gordonia zhenghanii]MCF8605748.1 TetR/AcrR family transcriptional regulator [Gordonia zhenghanii]